MPFGAETQVKLSGNYPLPWWDLRIAATIKSLRGAIDLASFVASNALIAPSLGRNVGTCGTAAVCNGNATIPNLFAPNTVRENRLNQADIRFSKALRIRGARLSGMFDIYNLFNASTITAVNSRYGSPNGGLWLTPTAFLPGRLFKFGAQLNF